MGAPWGRTIDPFWEVALMEDCKEFDILTVTTTVGSAQDARRLARELVEQRLAACVQLEEGLVSFYRWEGRLCDEPEVRLTMKTLPGKAAALQDFFTQHHPYDVPQFTASVVQASAAYAAWVRAEVEG
jgi:periplasmic divalent cation tolerance protein